MVGVGDDRARALRAAGARPGAARAARGRGPGAEAARGHGEPLARAARRGAAVPGPGVADRGADELATASAPAARGAADGGAHPRRRRSTSSPGLAAAARAPRGPGDAARGRAHAARRDDRARGWWTSCSCRSAPRARRRDRASRRSSRAVARAGGRAWSCCSALHDDGYLFLRYALRPAAAAGVGFAAVRIEGLGSNRRGRRVRPRRGHVACAGRARRERHDRGPERGEGRRARGRAGAATRRSLACDVTDEEQVARRSSTRGAPGDLRISVCCAGIGWAERTVSKRGPHQLMPFETVHPREPDRDVQRAALRGRRDERDRATGVGERGVCVNTASIAAFDGQIGQIAYSASKGGIVGMTLPAARDLAGRGIRVVTIAPGHVRHAAAGGAARRRRARSWAESDSLPAAARPPGRVRRAGAHIVENQMLNGETIRLDGALRMPPR